MEVAVYVITTTLLIFPVTWSEPGPMWRTCKSETLTLFHYQKESFVVPLNDAGCHFSHADNLLYCRDFGMTAAEITDDVIDYMDGLSTRDLNSRSAETCFWSAGNLDIFTKKTVWARPLGNIPVESTKIRNVDAVGEMMIPCLAICPGKIGQIGGFYLEFQNCFESLPPMCMKEDVTTVKPDKPIVIPATTTSSHRDPTTGKHETEVFTASPTHIVGDSTSIVGHTTGPRTDKALIPVSPTINPPNPITASKPNVAKAWTLKRMVGRQAVFRKLTVDVLLVGASLFSRKAYFITTCSRLCSHEQNCQVINFNKYTKTCRGFESFASVYSQKREQYWEVWILDYKPVLY